MKAQCLVTVPSLANVCAHPRQPGKQAHFPGGVITSATSNQHGEVHAMDTSRRCYSFPWLHELSAIGFYVFLESLNPADHGIRLEGLLFLHSGLETA